VAAQCAKFSQRLPEFSGELTVFVPHLRGFGVEGWVSHPTLFEVRESRSLRFGRDDSPHLLLACLAGGYGGVDHWIFGSYVFSPGTDQAVVIELLDDVGGPAGDSAYRENRCEQVQIDS